MASMQPGAFVGVVDVGHLVAGRAAVDLLQAWIASAALARLARPTAPPTTEAGRRARSLSRQTVRAVVELRIAGRLGAERIDVRGAVAEQADALGQRAAAAAAETSAEARSSGTAAAAQRGRRRGG